MTRTNKGGRTSGRRMNLRAELAPVRRHVDRMAGRPEEVRKREIRDLAVRLADRLDAASDKRLYGALVMFIRELNGELHPTWEEVRPQWAEALRGRSA